MTANRLALVTGGSRGIGMAIVEKLLHSGFQVITTGKSKRDFSIPSVEYHAVDFSDVEATQKFASQMADKKIDVLINNAGINKIHPFADIPLETFDGIQNVNVRAPFILTQAVLPGMKKRRWGRIVNISSVFGVVSRSERASYSTSKFGIYGMTAALAAEVASEGILVNCVAPGFVETELTQDVLGKKGIEEVCKTIPMGRLAHPSEIAEFVLWLVSEKNTYISGQNLLIDGGFTRV